MLLPHGTVIALVDGNKFELFRNSGNEAEPHLEKQEPPRLDTSNPSAGSHHESGKGSHGRHQDEEEVHSAAAVDWLNRQVLEHRIENLVVIAAPRTLGGMRPHYHRQLEQVLLKELPKDLTGSQGPAIVSALRGR